MTAPETTLKARFAAGETLFGTFLALGSPLAAEACGVAGMDWLLVDLEHGGGNEADVVGQLQGIAAGGTHSLVRVESDERARAARVLDLGAEGIMFPRIESVEQARRVVTYLRFPPDGVRGVATSTRSCRFGAFPEAIEQASERTLGVIQIENPAAVAAADEIAALDGVDVLFVGPNDLSFAMGLWGQLDHPELRAAFETVVAAAESHGKAAGTMARPNTVEQAVADRFRMIAIASDAALMSAGVKAALEAGRGALA
jgi:2-keto-3-deoxy-L-rhamnonate aldolase RhmA